MSTSALVFGVVGLNAVFLAVGYCLLSPSLRGAGLRSGLSYAGVALLVGAGLTGAVLCALAVAGARTGLLTFVLVAAGLALLGLLLGRVERVRQLLAPVARASRPGAGLRLDLVATAACSVLAAICGFALVGGFRSSPWLDDTWFFWVPKGIELSKHGLDLRLWGGDYRYYHYTSPDYPLWWSIVTGLDMRFVGSIDLRAVDGQLGILAIGFVGAVARLLWGLVRPWLLWPGLLLIVAAPEFFRQAQGGGADVPVASYVVLFVVAGGVWLARRDGLALFAAFAFAGAAVAIKNEGLPEIVLLALVLSLASWRAGWRPLASLWSTIVAAFVLALPWLLWRHVHGIRAELNTAGFFDPSFLLDRTSRIHPTVTALRQHLLSPRDWLVDVPLAVALALLAAVRTRRPMFLTPVLMLGVGFVFLVWVYWADRLDLQYRLSTSAYRVVDTLTLLAAASVPVLAEAVVTAGRGRTARRSTPAEAGASASSEPG